MTRGRGAKGALHGSDGPPPRHLPVLVSEVLESLAPKDGETYIDGTFGAGGYTRAILGAANCKVLALDRDPSAVRDAAALIDEASGRLKLVEAPFSEMEAVAQSELGGERPDGVVLDIGVSSMQLDDAARGFSFQHDGPLDMRMSAQRPDGCRLRQRRRRRGNRQCDLCLRRRTQITCDCTGDRQASR